MLKGLYIMNEQSIDLVYPGDVKEEIGSLVDIISKPMTAKEVEADPSILKDIDVIFSGWGALTFTEEILNAAPNLKAVFHAAGSIKPKISNDFFERDLIVTPHIAGSEGKECGRMGSFMLEELKRYLDKEELKWQVSKKQFDTMA